MQTELTLDAIRSEIDGLDDEILHLIQHRQRLAGRIGTLKDVAATGLKIRPDREANVVARRLARATPETRRIATAVWRELMSGGLAAQGGTEVLVWSGARRDVRDAARGRFGGSADYADAHSARTALDAALDRDAIAVLALDPDHPWWIELTERSDLWVLEGLGRRGALDPIALAVGKIDPSSLARGVTYRVTHGGDSGMEGRREKVLAVSDGRRLCVERDLGKGALDRDRGVIGAAAVL
jgi:chorismate mutase